MSLRSVSLDELSIADERSFAHVALYAQLKRVLRKSAHRFLIPEQGSSLSWDRAVFLNLTFWSDAGGTDVLCESSLPADVVAHIAWHRLAAEHLAPPGSSAGSAPCAPCAQALFFAEAIASAFDMYLVGRLLWNVPDSEFIATQVSIMGEAAEHAGLSESEFAELLDSVAQDPERAFEDLRELLFDVSRALLACNDPLGAERVLQSFDTHRFAALLHHYQLSNWVLYARAYGANAPDQEQLVQAADASLRAAPVALDLLAKQWLPSQTA